MKMLLPLLQILTFSGVLLQDHSHRVVIQPPELTLGFRLHDKWHLFHPPVVSCITTFTRSCSSASFALHPGEGLLNFTVSLSAHTRAVFAFPWLWLSWNDRWYAFEEPVLQMIWLVSQSKWIVNELEIPWPFEPTALCMLTITDFTQLLVSSQKTNCPRQPAALASSVSIDIGHLLTDFWDLTTILIVPIDQIASTLNDTATTTTTNGTLVVTSSQ
jgi:hypothetical protein